MLTLGEPSLFGDDFERRFPHRHYINLRDHVHLLKGCAVDIGRRGVNWDYRRDGDTIEFGVDTDEHWEKFIVRFVARLLTNRNDVL
jgi:hypothetical protein